MASDIQAMEAETQREINEMLAQLEKDEQKNVAALKEPEVSEEVLNEFKGSSEDSSLEETVGALKVENSEIVAEVAAQPVSRPTPVAVAAAPAPVATVTEFPKSVEMPSKASTSEGCLSMKLTGKMSLKLEYESDENTVSVSFEEDSFVVQLDGGAEFRLPIGKKKTKTQKTA